MAEIRDIESLWDDCLVPASDSSILVEEVLSLGRQHLELAVVFVGHVSDSQRDIRAVAAADSSLEAFSGHTEALAGTHCDLVLRGLLGPIVTDTLANSLMVKVQQTHDFNMRSFVGVPIVLSDGEVYGTLCGFSHVVRPDLGESTIRILRFLADIVATRVDGEHKGGRNHRSLRTLFEQVVDRGQPGMVFQPIAHLHTGHISGYEALARFDSLTSRTPDQWFAMAHLIGMGGRLEARAIANSLHRLGALPAECGMSVNVSARYLYSDEVTAVLFGADLKRVTVEITEHERDIDLTLLLDVCRCLRERGARIALDDFGSGYSGLERVVRIAPDRIKLDRVLVTGIDQHAARQAMVAATVTYADRVQAEIVAEGIETREELATLRGLGVVLGQGYLLAYPARKLIDGNCIGWLSAAQVAEKLSD